MKKARSSPCRPATTTDTVSKHGKMKTGIPCRPKTLIPSRLKTIPVSRPHLPSRHFTRSISRKRAKVPLGGEYLISPQKEDNRYESGEEVTVTVVPNPGNHLLVLGRRYKRRQTDGRHGPGAKTYPALRRCSLYCRLGLRHRQEPCSQRTPGRLLLQERQHGCDVLLQRRRLLDQLGWLRTELRREEPLLRPPLHRL